MTDFDDGEAVHSSAALYLLCALDPVQEAAFESHLASCRVCQRECDEIGPLLSGLSRLPDDEVAAQLGDSPADRPDRPRSVDTTGAKRDRSG